MKKFFKRPFRAISFGALLFSLIFVVSAAFAITASVGYAASSGEVTGLDNDNIGLSYSGDKENTWTASGTTITGSIKSSSGCGATDYSSTLTLTNKRTDAATLSFSYSGVLSSGEISVDGSKLTSDGTFNFSKLLESESSIDVFIKSGSTSSATSIKISSILLLANREATVTFVPVENGSFTVDGKEITTEFSITRSSTTKTVLEAEADSGFSFCGWKDLDSDKTLSVQNPWTTGFDTDINCR